MIPRNNLGFSTVLASALLFLPTAVLADVGHGGATAMGGPGEPGTATRVIEIVMIDNAFSLPEFTVQAGETIRFVIVNEGDFLHEFNIATTEMHASHRSEMMEMMEKGMLDAASMTGAADHDDPNSILLQPGQTGEITWTFGEPGELEFACNVPGHYESGMMGRLTVGPNPDGDGT